MWPRQRRSSHVARPALWLAVGAGVAGFAGAAGGWAAIAASGESAGSASSAPIASGTAAAGVVPRVPPSGARRQRLDVQESALRRILGRTLRQSGHASGAWVFDVSDRQVLFEARARIRRSLASNTKLFTAAVALRRLGPGTRLATVVLGDGELRPDRTFRGDLYLKGSGDPSLSRAGLRVLAQRLVAEHGIRRVTGRIVGDESAFDDRRGTRSSEYGVSREIGASLSALAMRDVISDNPAAFAAARFHDALEAQGVRIDSAPRDGRAPADARPLARVDSPTVARLVRTTLKSSSSQHSELLLKAVARARGGEGATRGGLRATGVFARRLGARPMLADGSGLSLDSRASPRSVGKLLLAMRGLPEFGAFHAALPIAGRDGTLRKRMRGTAARGRCRAKTGTRVTVSALSGYCSTRSGDTVVFSLLTNKTDPIEAKRLEDRMAAAIARLG